jgi:hypothetical protein
MKKKVGRKMRKKMRTSMRTRMRTGMKRSISLDKATPNPNPLFWRIY